MQIDLTDPATLQRLLDKHGVTPSRSAGQNFLICPEPVEAILAALDGGPTYVTELGAGAGPMTVALLAAGYSVRAIERDATLAAILQEAVPRTLTAQLELAIDDLRSVPWTWDQPYQLVGNIPYNLSGLILRYITQLDPAPTAVVLMVQREVARRMSAQVPDMNLLSLSVQLWGSVHPLMQVPAACFWPQPKVDSAVVMLVPEKHADTVAQREQVLACAKPFFQQKRKQVGGVLRRHFGLTAEQVTTVLGSLSIAPEMRPQELSLTQWQQLAAALGNS